MSDVTTDDFGIDPSDHTHATSITGAPGYGEAVAGRRGMPIPGNRGVDHIGFTVPDLAEATAFLIDVLGCEYMYQLGPYEDAKGTWMADYLGVDKAAVMKRLNFLRCGPITLEVFEYSAPDQNTRQPRNSDIGGHHIALYVDDLDAAVEALRQHDDVTIFAGPTASKNASEGQRWIYFTSPWGMQFELVSYPNGKAYDRWVKEGRR